MLDKDFQPIFAWQNGELVCTNLPDMDAIPPNTLLFLNIIQPVQMETLNKGQLVLVQANTEFWGIVTEIKDERVWVRPGYSYEPKNLMELTVIYAVPAT